MASPTVGGNSSGSSSRSWGVARILAPVALIVLLIASYAVVTGSLSIDDDGTSAEPAQSATSGAGGDGGAADGDGDGAETPKTYTVESGDVLSSIAEQFGVSVERLIRLNPDVDPNTLNAGAVIKIR